MKSFSVYLKKILGYFDNNYRVDGLPDLIMEAACMVEKPGLGE